MDWPTEWNKRGGYELELSRLIAVARVACAGRAVLRCDNAVTRKRCCNVVCELDVFWELDVWCYHTRTLCAIAPTSAVAPKTIFAPPEYGCIVH